MSKEMFVVDYYMMFANALKDMDNLISDSKELYKKISGFDYPNMPEIKNKDDIKEMYSAIVLKTDINNAEKSLIRCLGFVASTLGLTYDELATDDVLQVDFKTVLVEITEEETVYSPEYIYENLLDCYTYFYDLLETLDRMTGIRFKEHLTKSFGKKKTHRLMELIYDLNEEADGHKYINYFFQIIFDAVCAFAGLENLLNFFDELYGFDKGTAVNEIGDYNGNYLPYIENKYLKFTRC